MNHLLVLAMIMLICIPAPGQEALGPGAGRPLNIVVLTGGHDFDRNAFPRLFQGHDDLNFEIIALKDHSEIFEDIAGFKYDLIVLYNMTQRISEKRRANFVALLERGVGLVALHHSICAFQEWPEYNRIIGARYFQKAETFDGREYARSSYKHNVDMPIRVVDDAHPITRGIRDFVLHDETYKGQWIDPEAHLLLSTDHPDSDKSIAWCRTYRNARIFTLQLGHGPQAFTDSNYRRLVAQGVRWVGRR
jgi:uncharacterized protein